MGGSLSRKLWFSLSLKVASVFYGSCEGQVRCKAPGLSPEYTRRQPVDQYEMRKMEAMKIRLGVLCCGQGGAGGVEAAGSMLYHLYRLQEG